MTESIVINVGTLREKLAEMRVRQTSALTTEIIDCYMGGFHSNKDVPAAVSWNAQFGKYLKAHQPELGVRELTSNQKVTVGGTTTTASLWSLMG